MNEVTWGTWSVVTLYPWQRKWRVQQFLNGKPVWYPPHEAYSETDANAFIMQWERTAQWKTGT